MDHEKNGSNYGRFIAMIATSTIAMFGLMYLNSYALEHVYFSQTRMWMALYMGGHGDHHAGFHAGQVSQQGR